MGRKRWDPPECEYDTPLWAQDPNRPDIDTPDDYALTKYLIEGTKGFSDEIVQVCFTYPEMFEKAGELADDVGLASYGEEYEGIGFRLMDRLNELFNDLPISRLMNRGMPHEYKFGYIKDTQEGKIIHSEQPEKESHCGFLCYVRVFLNTRDSTGKMHRIPLIVIGQIGKDVYQVSKTEERTIYRLCFDRFTVER